MRRAGCQPILGAMQISRIKSSVLEPSNRRALMHKLMAFAVAALAIGFGGPCAGQTSYSTGAVSNYPANPCFGPNLPYSVGSAASFRSWYSLNGLTNVTRWENN